MSAPGTYIVVVVVTDPSGNQTNCLDLVNVVPATSAAPALASAPIVAALYPAATIGPTTVNLGLAPAPATAAAVVTPTPVAAPPPVSNPGQIMLIPQELPDEAMPAVARPLGDRRPFVRSASRWWLDWG